jgi:multimeric flavodoxin WrbA
MGNITGKLKTFIDRTCSWYHRPELIGIPLLAVVSTAGSSLKDTLNYLEKVAIFWGMQPAGKIGKKVGEYDLVEADDYNEFIWYLKHDKSQYSPSLKQLIHYQVQKILAEKILDIDRKYWDEKGWLDKLYYYDCKINIFKRVIATIFYKILWKKIE